MSPEELYKWLVEDLWASFDYNSPEEHARVILTHISKEFIEDLHENPVINEKLIEKWEDLNNDFKTIN